MARVRAHDVTAGPRSIPCWTYVTDGFVPAGQKEFVFTLVRAPGDDPTRPPADPLRFFTQIYSLAQQGQFVEAGGFTCFRARAGGFLGLTGLVGFAYTRPETLPGAGMPPADRCLAAVLLLPGEAEWVQSFGSYRVLARLCRAAKYYPHPPWSDPRRTAVLTPDEPRGSLLGKMPAAYLSGVSVRTFLRPTAVPPPGEIGDGSPLGDWLTLRIRRDRLPRVRELLSEVAAGSEGAFALGLDADSEANARLVWQPGDDGVNTITPATGDASCLTGGFLAVAFGPDIAGGGRVIEDGFAVTLALDPWQRLRDALTDGESVALPAAGPGHLGLSVEWVGPAPSGAAVEPAASGFRIESMLLYQPDEVLRERVPSVSSVAEYVKRLEAAAAEFWGGRPAGPPQPVLVVVAVKPGGRVRVWVEVPAGLGTEEAARECAGRLERVPGPVVQHGPVAVALRASLWGGLGEWPFIPKEWQDAVAGVGNVLIPDDILERVWPGEHDPD